MKKTSSNIFSILKGLWPTISKWLVKVILKKLLPKIIAGPWGWVVTFFGEKVFNKVLRPAWNWITRKGFAITRKWKRKPKVKRLENADNETDFDSSVDDLP